MIPPRPAAPDGTRRGVLAYARAFRRDILSALPARLFGAWMADFRSPLIRSVLLNDPAAIRTVLADADGAFPKSPRLTAGLHLLLGGSVFLSGGPAWAAQRRVIDPAFAGGRLASLAPELAGAAARLAGGLAPGPADLEPPCAAASADVIWRVLFGAPIPEATAARVLAAFRAHRATAPVVTPAALWPRLPAWHGRAARTSAATIRAVIAEAVAAQPAGADTLAARLLATPDPVTGTRLDALAAADQVALFFLAGHETSAAALAWALWLLAADDTGWQDRVAAEAAAIPPADALAPRPLARAVWRETLRLYPPVPMLVRRAARPAVLRGRTLPAGTEVVVSPWHLHRHRRLWSDPDRFDPGRWTDPVPEGAFLPFGAGPRVCPGAGLAMVEGPLLVAAVVAAWRLAPAAPAPVPEARLTLRSADGIRVLLAPRGR